MEQKEKDPFEFVILLQPKQNTHVITPRHSLREFVTGRKNYDLTSDCRSGT